MIVPYRDYEPALGAGVWIAPNATVIGDVTIGADSSVWFHTLIRGDVHRIVIGERCNIQDNSTVHVTGPRGEETGAPTLIGDDVTVGHNAIIHGCRIGNRCLIGMGAIVLDNAVIGEDSIVGAGAVVTGGKVFPPRSLILGSPAQVVKPLSDKQLAHLPKSAQGYMELKEEYMAAEQAAR